jgi:dihydrofolate reductase
MRKVTFGGASSLDNFFAREDHSVDWLMWSPQAGEIMKAYWKNVDTVVMGRITYEIATKARKKPESGPFAGVKGFVCSRTMIAAPDGAELVTDAVKFIRDLKTQPGKEICIMGGGDLARSLLEADLIDEIGFNIHPVLLGAGVPVFHRMNKQIDLELIETRPFKNGCVYVLYRVKHDKH